MLVSNEHSCPFLLSFCSHYSKESSDGNSGDSDDTGSDEEDDTSKDGGEEDEEGEDEDLEGDYIKPLSQVY